MPAPNRSDLYEAAIRKMLDKALEEQETVFMQEHGQSSDEELLEYLCCCAAELGYTPRYKEVVGWDLIDQRFGTWNAALRRAGLVPAASCPVMKLPRIVEETERQKQLYREKKAAKKLKKCQRRQEQERKNKARKKA